MQPINVKDKYAAAIFHEGKKTFIGHLPLGKSEKFANFCFLFSTNSYRKQMPNNRLW